MTVDIDLKKVEAFAAQGMTNEQIADALGISRSCHFKKKKAEVHYLHAIKQGQAKGIATVTNQLFKNATDNNNLGAQCFYLKNRAGWADKTDMNVTHDVITPMLPDYLKKNED